MKYFSMFSGIGGFELGIQRAYNHKLQQTKTTQRVQNERWEWNTNKQRDSILPPENTTLCVGYSEIDKHSIKTYEKNFGKEVRNYGDATKIKPEKLPDFDMLCGGFPCQAFSVAGKRKGFEDTRGTLFFEIERILKVKRPKIVFLENVKGLLSHEKGQTFRIIIQRLEALGYNTQWMVLNSKFFGVPQNRERVFIIGSLREEPRPEILPFGESGEKANKQQEFQEQNTSTITSSMHKITRGMPLIADYRNDEGLRIRKEPIAPCLSTRKHPESDISTMPSLVIPILTANRCPTLTEPRHNNLRVREGIKIRRLTPLECERLQGFSDNWTEGVSDTQRYKQLGNAVTVNVIEAIASRLFYEEVTLEELEE